MAKKSLLQPTTKPLTKVTSKPKAPQKAPRAEVARSAKVKPAPRSPVNGAHQIGVKENPKNKNGHKTEVLASKEALIQAAMPLFAKRGFDGVTVKDLAQAAQVNVSLVSYYFEGKAGLYKACLESFGQERLKWVESILTTPDSFEDFRLKLKIWLETVILDQVEQADAIAMIHREMSEGLPLARDLFEKTFVRLFEVVLGYLTAAREKKFIRADLDPMCLSMILHGFLIYLCSTEKVRTEFFKLSIKDAAFRSKISQHYLGVFLKGVIEEEKSL